MMGYVFSYLNKKQLEGKYVYTANLILFCFIVLLCHFFLLFNAKGKFDILPQHYTGLQPRRPRLEVLFHVCTLCNHSSDILFHISHAFRYCSSVISETEAIYRLVIMLAYILSLTHTVHLKILNISHTERHWYSFPILILQVYVIKTFLHHGGLKKRNLSSRWRKVAWPFMKSPRFVHSLFICRLAVRQHPYPCESVSLLETSLGIINQNFTSSRM
jgi:hypothetical protein